MENGVVDDSSLLTTPSGKEVGEHEDTSLNVVESEANVVHEDSISLEASVVTLRDTLNSVVDSEMEVEIFKEAIGTLSATENHKDEVEQAIAHDKIKGVVVPEDKPNVEETVSESHQGETTEDKPIVGETVSESHQGETTDNDLNSTVDADLTLESEFEVFRDAIGISSVTENHKDEIQQAVAEDKVEDVAGKDKPIVEEAVTGSQVETTANDLNSAVNADSTLDSEFEVFKEAIGVSSWTENDEDEVQQVVAGNRIEDVAADNEIIVEGTSPDAHQEETTTNREISEVTRPEDYQIGAYETEKAIDESSSATENHKDEAQSVAADDKREVMTLNEEPTVEATAPDAHQGEVKPPEEHPVGAYEKEKEKEAVGTSSATENHKDEFHFVAAEDKREVVAAKEDSTLETTAPDAHQQETTSNEEIVEVIMSQEHQNCAHEREKADIVISPASKSHKEEVQFVDQDKIESVVADGQTIVQTTAPDGEEQQNGAYERENLADLQINNYANNDSLPPVPEADSESSQEPKCEEKHEICIEPMEETKNKHAVAIPSSSQKSTTAHPAGLGRAAPLSEPAPRAVHHTRVNEVQTQNQSVEETLNNGVGEAMEEYDETREKLQMIRVKFLRLARRLGQTSHNAVVAQVLYRLGLAEQIQGSGGRVAAFSFDRASAMAEQLEVGGQEPLDFSCTIMVLGKTGVGKSATINSIFEEIKFKTDAFRSGTKKVEDVVGTVQGIKVRVIDTPGLLPSWTDQQHNFKILRSVKQFMKKTPPDIVLYLDRLDMQSRDLTDLPLLRTITETFGPSIWFNAIVVLTHAASAPPEGPNGTTTSYDMFVTQRSHAVQQAIRMAAGDMRLLNPISLVENHSACRINRSGQRVLPNGQVWKPHLLLLSFASKILTEANDLLKLQDGPPGRPFTMRTRSPPLPYLLSSLLQSRPQLRLPEEQFGGDDDDIDEDSSESENESEIDELPPFKPLTRAELAKLSKAQNKAYSDEIEYREKLFMKKQLKEEKMRRKMMKKKMAAAAPNDVVVEEESEEGAAASVPVAMPDLTLPASFDADYPSHRYRCLDTPNQWVVRPVLDTQGWDHDVGYEGVNVERLFVAKKKIPISLSGQLTKDKKDSTLQMELATSLKHGEGKATSLGFDMQMLGKDMAYTIRGETGLSNRRRNKFAAGVSATLLGDTLAGGIKLEDKLIVNKRFRMVLSGGAMAGHNDIAYGGSLEATLRDKDHPLGRFLTTLGLSVMDWHGDLALGGNLQSQIPIGRFTNLIARGNLNNRGSGNVSIRVNSSEQIQISLIALIPLISKLVGYPQQLHYGQ